MRQVKFNLFSIFTEIPLKLISAHTFAYISLDAMIPQEADQTHIEYWVSCGITANEAHQMTTIFRYRTQTLR